MPQQTNLNSDDNKALFQYLRDVSNDSTFATAVLQVLVEERRTAHRERSNQGQEESPFKVGDVVKAHVQVQSNASTGVVAKLSYRAKGPFQIIEDLGHNSYYVQRYNEPNSAKRKYKGQDLYLLPPSIFPVEPLDTMDTRFLNYEHAPIASPLQKSLKIELYNDQFFHTPNTISQPSRNQPSTPIDELTFKSHIMQKTIPSAQPESSVPVEPEDAPTPKNHQPTIHQDITTSKDKLFFVHFTPANTLRKRWYLVQVNIQDTAEVNPDYHNNHKYFCTFLAKHPSDKHLSDELSCWWPDWYRYKTDTTTGQIVYGNRILIRPNTNPDPTKFVPWATDLELTTSATARNLIGPFNFEPISQSNRTKQTVPSSLWRQLKDICISHHILPPTLGSTSSNIPQTRHRQKRTTPPQHASTTPSTSKKTKKKTAHRQHRKAT